MFLTKWYNNPMTFQEVEVAREAYHQKIKKQMTITIAIIVVLSIISLFGAGIMMAVFGLIFSSIVISSFAVIIFSITNRKVADAYRKAYKAYFVEQNLRKVFTDLRYSHEMGLSRQVLEQTGMVNTGDRYSSNDYTNGKYRDVAFSQADVHIQNEQTDSDGDTYYVTIFKGRFMIFEFPKKFNFKLGLIGKKFHAYRKPSSDKATGRKMEKITTESSEFNSAFRIYGADGFESYYILDPAFMVKLLKINEHYKGKTIFCFNNNQLLIGTNDGKDSFEPPRPNKPIDEAKENAKVLAEIKAITDFVDQLSLDRKLFK